MACGGCGRRPKNRPVSRYGDKKKSSLKKYAYLNPNQIELLKLEEQKEKENSEEENK